ncbi:MAG: glycerol-3-phosphate 1-O-acyltransferase PlsY [Oscillospiraceae bacterium]|nr:glycerol-3-phosphate 1-O-acyltransferase PlsY [Oscillospiraceae bacterium]
MVNIIFVFVLIAIISYLIGSLNFAIIFSLLIKKQDIRKYGSKNAGMTNIVRIYGAISGIPVFIGDFLKSILAIYLCNFLFSDFLSLNKFGLYGNLIIGLAVIIGHLYPVYFKFRGGKGIVTSAGVILTQDIRFFITVLVVFLAFFLIFKIVAIASISAAVAYPISTLIFFNNFMIFIFALIISSLVIYAHRSNIKKIINK